MKIFDQLQYQNVQQMIEILRMANSPMIAKLEEKEKSWWNTGNNIKHLSTSFEYFLIYHNRYSGDSLPGLMYGLKMLWYFCNDEQMLPMLGSITKTLFS
jgi:hypothetical protein